MEKVMVAIFDDESKAYQGVRALRKLDDDGSIVIHGGAMVRRDGSGTTVIPNSELDEFPVGTLGGSLVGGAIGLLAGPAGGVAGAGMGAIAGFAGDMAMATVDEDLVYEVSQRLQPGKCAIVLDVTEDWITPVDTELEPFAIAIYRRPRVDVEDELMEKRVEADQREMEALERELSQAHEERKARIHARMEELRNRTRRQMDRMKEYREQIRSENEAKLQALQKKISSANSEMKDRLQSHMDDLRRQDQEDLDRIHRAVGALQQADMNFTERVESSIARRLHRVAEHFERKKAA